MFRRRGDRTGLGIGVVAQEQLRYRLPERFIMRADAALHRSKQRVSVSSHVRARSRRQARFDRCRWVDTGGQKEVVTSGGHVPLGTCAAAFRMSRRASPS
jgi:hypothetical protein